jgi:predicted nucleic acid-binding protein
LGGELTLRSGRSADAFAPRTVARAGTVALTRAEATADAAAFGRRFSVLEDGPPVWDKLMDLSRRYSFGGRQVHDANVVATMLAHGERRLLTFNEADFRRFTPLIEVVAP